MDVTEPAPTNDSQELADALRLRLENDPTNKYMLNSFIMLTQACFDTQFAEYEYFILKKPFNPTDYATRHAAVGKALERLKALADAQLKGEL